MNTTRALIGTGLLAGFAIGILTGTAWLIITAFLAILAVLLSADRRDRSGGARDTDLPGFHRQER